MTLAPLNDVSFPVASEWISRSALFYRRRYFTDGTIFQVAETVLGFTRRVDKSLHFLFAKGLETKSFLVALFLVTGYGFCLSLDESVISVQSANCTTFCVVILS